MFCGRLENNKFLLSQSMILLIYRMDKIWLKNLVKIRPLAARR